MSTHTSYSEHRARPFVNVRVVKNVQPPLLNNERTPAVMAGLANPLGR